MFTLPKLPYGYDALEPHISERTMHFHYDKHHSGYVDKLNDAIEDIDFSYESLEDVVTKSAGRDDLTHVYNNAAQVWNHTFFWNCMSPDGGGKPTGELKDAIDADFGSLEKFRDAFVEAATGRFGSGYAWLARGDKGLIIRDTANADPTFIDGDQPLLGCDVWEHAYYLDYQNVRADFVKVFLEKLINWEFVASRFADDTPEPLVTPD